MAKTKIISSPIGTAIGKPRGRKTTKYRHGTPDGSSGKVKNTEVIADGRTRKTKTKTTTNGKKVKSKTKYHKDGSIKKVVTREGGKRRATKYHDKKTTVKKGSLIKKGSKDVKKMWKDLDRQGVLKKNKKKDSMQSKFAKKTKRMWNDRLKYSDI